MIAAWQRSILRTVFGINLGMFFFGSTAGILAYSTALLADSVDMLADATPRDRPTRRGR